MPIYEYVCAACGHQLEVIHGVNEPGPGVCPNCGVEGELRKAFAPPAIVFKGSGWAKKDRAGSGSRGSSKSGSGASSGSQAGSGSESGSPATSAASATESD